MLGMIAFWPQMGFFFFASIITKELFFTKAKFVEKYENELRDVGFL
jgi:hypothetical protein